MARRASVAALLAFVASAGLACAGWALDLPLPRGAAGAFSETTDPDSLRLPTGPFDGNAVPVETLEGRVSRQAFQIDNESVTLLQIVRPIRAALREAGYEIILDCAAAGCGGFEFRFDVEVLPAPAMFVDLTAYRYLTARNGPEAIAVLASGTRTRRFLQVIRVGPSSSGLPGAGRPGPDLSLAAPPVPPQAAPDGVPPGAPLADRLDGDGRVVLDDLSFQTGRTALSDGPYASLEALARYLAARPGARLALVGHTDAVGGLDGNITLSQARAGAVLRRLVERHGVDPEQLTARGIGYLAPRDSNLTEAGRARNRRVEAVLLEAE